MKLTKDEQLKKLAKALLDNQMVCSDGLGECFICEEKYFKHKEDCPILIAEEILKDCQKCIRVGANNKCNCINKNKYEEDFQGVDR